MEKFKRKTFTKGLLMGICDLIPGISGGTIAFITGIYEGLINALKGFSPSLLYGLLLLLIGKGDRRKVREDIKKLDLKFLITLLAGIVLAVFIFSRLMGFLLESYFSFTMAFFIGLILASAKTIFDHIEKHHSLNMVFLVVGLAAGISLAFLIPVSVQPSFGYVFLGGFLAVCAMILPGISGSFILLILGLYEFMLGVINNLFDNLLYVIIFILGAIAGLLIMSRAVSFLLKKDKSKTLYFLLGLVIGALSVPLREIYHSVDLAVFGLIIHVILFVLGIVAALFLRKFAKKK